MSRDEFDEHLRAFKEAADWAQEALQQMGVTFQEAGRAMSNWGAASSGNAATFTLGEESTAWWDADAAAVIDRLGQRAVRKGVARHDIMGVIQKAHARAAIEDHDEAWVFERISEELNRLILMTHDVNYNPSEDVAKVGARMLMDRAQPSNPFTCWDDVMRSLEGVGLEKMIQLTDEARQGARIVTVYEARHQSEHDTIQKAREAQFVVACALADVPVRVQVRTTDQRTMRDLIRPKPPEGMQIRSVPDNVKSAREAINPGEWYEAMGR